MTNYIFAYYGGKTPETPEEGNQGRARFLAWIESLGDAVVDPGTPLGNTKTVSPDGIEEGGGQNPLTGFSVITAKSMDEALGMARRCPFLEMGTIGVSEVMEMQNTSDEIPTHQ